MHTKKLSELLKSINNLKNMLNEHKALLEARKKGGQAPEGFANKFLQGPKDVTALSDKETNEELSRVTRGLNSMRFPLKRDCFKTLEDVFGMFVLSTYRANSCQFWDITNFYSTNVRSLLDEIIQSRSLELMTRSETSKDDVSLSFSQFPFAFGERMSTTQYGQDQDEVESSSYSSK